MKLRTGKKIQKTVVAFVAGAAVFAAAQTFGDGVRADRVGSYSTVADADDPWNPVRPSSPSAPNV